MVYSSFLIKVLALSADNVFDIDMDMEVLTMTIQCCRCKKVKAGKAWTLPGHMDPATVSHSYCPVCLEQTVDEMRAERDHANRAGSTPSCFSAA